MSRLGDNPPVIGLLLIACFCAGMDRLLGSDGRECLPVQGLHLVAGVDRSYAGSYASDPRFLRRLAGVHLVRERAILRGSQTSGLDLADSDDFVLRFKDAEPGSSFGASNRPVRTQDREVHLVTLSAEQFVIGVMDLESTLTHEYVHCAMRERLGERRYRALPRWVREGAAVWAAGQLDELGRNLVARAFMERTDPERLLSICLREPDEYMRDALTFAYLEHEHGADAVRRLIADWSNGAGVEDALRAQTGLGLAQLERRSARFSQAYYQELVGSSGLEDFLAAEQLAMRGDWQGGVALLADLAERRPGCLLAPQARYWMGRLSEQNGRYAGAAEAYAALLQHHPDQLGLQDDARIRLARCLCRMDRCELALDRLETFFTGEPPESVLAEARFAIGEAQYKLGVFDQSARNLRQAVMLRSRHSHEALAYLCLACLHAGHPRQSRLVFSELAARCPGYRRLPEIRREIELAERLAQDLPPMLIRDAGSARKSRSCAEVDRRCGSPRRASTSVLRR
ncbi:MAG: tetratricopeptide repeat protein [Deltaproteobacteria bacterium]|nr:tetratricopeptide repeat protein [Deltaproteobacteria bacterium]